MQALLEIITGVFAALATLVLAQFGLDLNTQRDPQPREVHRTNDCAPEPSSTLLIATESKRNC